MLRCLLKAWEAFGAELILGSVQGVFLPSEGQLKSACEHPWLGLFCGLRMEGSTLTLPGQSSALLACSTFRISYFFPF